MVEWLFKEGDLDAEAADDDDATLRDGDGRKDSDTKMRVPSMEESVSPAKIHKDDKFWWNGREGWKAKPGINNLYT